MTAVTISPHLRLFLAAAALEGLLSVALGAFGAHGLRGTLGAEQLATYETACRYLMYHSLALLALSGSMACYPEIAGLRAIGLLWIAGSGIFSGSLYILCLTELRGLAWLTPVGGVLLLLGWGYLLWVACMRLRGGRSTD